MYRRGDFYRIDDNSGFRVRASRTAKQWDGLYTTDPDERNPQDFVRGRKDNQNVPDPRPESVDTFLGPLTTVTTAAASAAATTITVQTTARFANGDHIRITLADNDVYPAIVQSVSSSTTLLLTAGLPSAVGSGALVVNTSAIAEADYDR